MRHWRRAFRTGLALGALLGARIEAQPPSAPATTRHVVVDGRTVRVRVSGLDRRKAGSPVIVFEAGATNSLDVFASVLPRAERLGPVVAYDRAGLGQSAWDEKSPTPQHVANRLRALLREIDAPPPYVIVGYSWGGALARYFAGYYPDEVAGLVYVDPGPIVTQSLADELAPYDAIGAGRAGYDAFWSRYAEIIERVSPAARAEFAVYRDLMRRDASERDLRPVPAVPVTVILAAKPYPSLPGLPYDADAHFRADLRHRLRMLQEWALTSPHGTIVVSNTTTHAVPREDPELIVWALERVLAAAARRP